MSTTSGPSPELSDGSSSNRMITLLMIPTLHSVGNLCTPTAGATVTPCVDGAERRAPDETERPVAFGCRCAVCMFGRPRRAPLVSSFGE